MLILPLPNRVVSLGHKTTTSTEMKYTLLAITSLYKFNLCPNNAWPSNIQSPNSVKAKSPVSGCSQENTTSTILGSRYDWSHKFY